MSVGTSLKTQIVSLQWEGKWRQTCGLMMFLTVNLCTWLMLLRAIRVLLTQSLLQGTWGYCELLTRTEKKLFAPTLLNKRLLPASERFISLRQGIYLWLCATNLPENRSWCALFTSVAPVLGASMLQRRCFSPSWSLVWAVVAVWEWGCPSCQVPDTLWSMCSSHPVLYWVVSVLM